AGAFLNALKHHVARKHGTEGLRGVFQGRLGSSGQRRAAARPPCLRVGRRGPSMRSMSARRYVGVRFF
ncbi:hypothetical protein BRN78_04645, partial [Xanthomonas oryzae pv. oryzae]